jgi:hypothetical protein
MKVAIMFGLLMKKLNITSLSSPLAASLLKGYDRGTGHQSIFKLAKSLSKLDKHVWIGWREIHFDD